MLYAAGSLRWLRDTLAPDAPFDALIAEAAAWQPGRRRPGLPPVPPGRENAARGPGRPRRLHGAPAPPRSRRARARGARGRGVRAPRLARDSAWARDRGVERAGVRRRGALGALARDLCVGARSPDRAHRRRGRLGVRRGAPRRRRGRRLRRRAARRSPQPCASKNVVEPDAEWARRLRRAAARYRALYPALRDLDRSTVAG